MFEAVAGLGFLLCYFILKLVTAWKVFVKYGEPGWKGLIPIYSDIVEYNKIWGVKWFWITLVVGCVSTALSGIEDPGIGVLIVAVIVGIITLVLEILYARNKAKAFGKGVGMTIIILLFPFIGNLLLGLGSAEYVGNQN